MPDDSFVEELLSHIVQRLQTVAGIEAVGGALALGSHTSHRTWTSASLPDSPPDGRAETRHRRDRRRTPQRHHPPLHEWGPWINGGGWLKVRGLAVDFLYRDLAQVEQVIDDCRAGEVQIFYQAGHPHGFVTSIYMGEVAVCRPLWDPHGTLQTLKAQTDPYPPALQRAVMDKFTWEARFSLDTARKSAARGDAEYVAGCCFRSAACLMQTLFALNRRYLLNERA